MLDQDASGDFDAYLDYTSPGELNRSSCGTPSFAHSSKASSSMPARMPRSPEVSSVTGSTLDTPTTDISGHDEAPRRTRKARETAAERYRRLKGRQEAAFTGLEDEVQFNEWEDTLDKVGEIELPVLPRPETSEENKARKKREKHEAEEAKIRLKERDRKHKLSSTGSKKNIFSMKKNMLEKASSKFSLSSGSAGTSEVDLRLMESRDTMSSRVTRETSIGGMSSIVTMGQGVGNAANKWGPFNSKTSKMSGRHKGVGIDSLDPWLGPNASIQQPTGSPFQQDFIFPAPQTTASMVSHHIEDPPSSILSSPKQASKRLSLVLESGPAAGFKSLADRRPSTDLLPRDPFSPRIADSEQTGVQRPSPGLASPAMRTVERLTNDPRPFALSPSSNMSEGQLFYVSNTAVPLGMSQTMSRGSSNALPEAAEGVGGEEATGTGLGFGQAGEAVAELEHSRLHNRRPSLPNSPKLAPTVSSPRRAQSTVRAFRQGNRRASDDHRTREMFFSLDESRSGFPFNIAAILPREISYPIVTAHYPCTPEREIALKETVFPPFPAHMGAISTLVLSGIVWKRIWVAAEMPSPRSISAKFGMMSSPSKAEAAGVEDDKAVTKYLPSWQKVFMAMSLYTTFLPTPESSPSVESFPLPPTDHTLPNETSAAGRSVIRKQRSAENLAETFVHLHIFPLELQDSKSKPRGRSNSTTSYMSKEQRYELERRAITGDTLAGWGRVEGPEDVVRGNVLRVAWQDEPDGDGDWFCVMDDESELLAWVKKIRKYAEINRVKQTAIRAFASRQGHRSSTCTATDDEISILGALKDAGIEAPPPPLRGGKGKVAPLAPVDTSSDAGHGDLINTPVPATPTPNDWRFAAGEGEHRFPTVTAASTSEGSYFLRPLSTSSASMLASEQVSVASHLSHRTFGNRASVSTTASTTSGSEQDHGTGKMGAKKVSKKAAAIARLLPPPVPPPSAPLPPLPLLPAELRGASPTLPSTRSKGRPSDPLVIPVASEAGIALARARSLNSHLSPSVQSGVALDGDLSQGFATVSITSESGEEMEHILNSSSLRPNASMTTTSSSPFYSPGEPSSRGTNVAHSSSRLNSHFSASSEAQTSRRTPMTADGITPPPSAMPVPVELNMSQTSLATSTNSTNTTETADSESTRGMARKRRMKAAAMGIQDEIRAQEEAETERLLALMPPPPAASDKPKTGRTVRFGEDV